MLDVMDRCWPLLGRMASVHTAVYRATQGRIGKTIPGGYRVLLLNHLGARSGRRRTTPVLYFPDGDDLVIVASKGGYPRHPAWFHNVRANPDTTVELPAEKRQVRARQAGPGERTRLWRQAVASYPAYEAYQRRTSREIPIVVLETRP